MTLHVLAEVRADRDGLAVDARFDLAVEVRQVVVLPAALARTRASARRTVVRRSGSTPKWRSSWRLAVVEVHSGSTPAAPSAIGVLARRAAGRPSPRARPSRAPPRPRRRAHRSGRALTCQRMDGSESSSQSVTFMRPSCAGYVTHRGKNRSVSSEPERPDDPTRLSHVAAVQPSPARGHRRRLTDEQLSIRPAPDLLPIWAAMGHTAAMRVYWLCEVVGEPGVDSTPFWNGSTTIDWADDLDRPHSADRDRRRSSTRRFASSTAAWTDGRRRCSPMRSSAATATPFRSTPVARSSSVSSRTRRGTAASCRRRSGINGLPQPDLWRPD